MQVMEFKNGVGQMRCIMEKQEPWFIAKDICNALDISRTNDAVKKLDEDEKLMRKVSASGQDRSMWTVNESGLYNLIFRSNKPEANRFRKWVTSEVLPQIRKTGGYEAPKATPPECKEIEQMLQACAPIAGSYTKLARRIGVSPAHVSFMSQGMWDMVSTDMIDRVHHVLRHILDHGIAYNEKTLEMVMSIEDKKVREQLFLKMKRGELI